MIICLRIVKEGGSFSTPSEEIKEDKKIDSSKLFAVYYCGDVVRNSFNLFFKVAPIFSIAAILFLGITHILITEFIPLFSENSLLLANMGSLGIAMVGLVLIILGELRLVKSY